MESLLRESSLWVVALSFIHYSVDVQGHEEMDEEKRKKLELKAEIIRGFIFCARLSSATIESYWILKSFTLVFATAAKSQPVKADNKRR